VDDQYIETQLKKFNITDASIYGLERRFGDLKIANIEDAEGYKVVRAARLEIKSYRIEIDKRRKELTEDALKYQRAINAEAKRITSMLSPLEDQLHEQEKAHEVELERIKKENEQFELQRIQSRINQLLSFGFTFDGASYKADFAQESITVSAEKLRTVSEEAFETRMVQVRGYYYAKLKADLEAKERAEAERKAEQDRIEQQRREQAAKEKELAEREAKIKAEEERIAKEKVKLSPVDVELVKDTGFSIPECLDPDARPTLVISQLDVKVEDADNMPAGHCIAVMRDVVIDVTTIRNFINGSEEWKLREVTDEKIEEILAHIDYSLDEAIEGLIFGLIEEVTKNE
jgi:hypothetical protein